METEYALMNKELGEFFIRRTKDIVKQMRNDFEGSLVY